MHLRKVINKIEYVDSGQQFDSENYDKKHFCIFSIKTEYFAHFLPGIGTVLKTVGKKRH